jgi:hypothetical protein
MSQDLLVDSIRRAEIAAPMDGFDLTQWLFSLSHGEYRACSNAHLGAAASHDADGRRISINVERIGQDVLVQHYQEDQSREAFCRVKSMTDLVTPHGRTKLLVTWEVSLHPLAADRCEFANRIVCHATPELAAALAAQGVSLADAAAGMQNLADTHNEEETPLFARNIEDRILGRAPAVRPSAGLETFGGEIVAQSSCEAVIDAPMQTIDLAAWVLDLPDADYQACSADHIAAGLAATPTGQPLSLNVEQPGSFMVQHYLVAEAGPHHCRLVSPRSDVFSPAGASTLGIDWDLKLTPLDGDRCLFTNSVVVHATPEFLAGLATAGVTLDQASPGVGQRLGAHNADETPKFARDIARKVAERQQAVA